MSEPSQGPGFHPLYLQVKELLIQRVLSGDWKPGEVLPSETKLAAEYQVSQGTVRKAIEEMAADRLVVRYQGKGTYVAARGFNSSLHFFSIVNADDHVAPAGTPLQFDWSECPANEREQRELHLSREELVYRIYRVRPVDDRPALIERISVPSARFPGLPESMRNSARMNAYLIMEKDYNTLVVRADEWLDAVNATEDDAAQLGVAEGTALLRVHRVSYALDGAPVERRTIRLLSRELCYRNTLR